MALTKNKLSKKDKLAILMRARVLVARRWVKGTYERKAGGGYRFKGYCLAGACQRAAIELGLEDEKRVSRGVAAMHVSLHDKVKGMGYDGVPEYNDAFDRTQNEVLAIIDERIRELK